METLTKKKNQYFFLKSMYAGLSSTTSLHLGVKLIVGHMMMTNIYRSIFED